MSDPESASKSAVQSAPLLEAKELEKSFKQRKVVNGVHIEVRSGEIVGLLGPNGAGKTTSFNLVIPTKRSLFIVQVGLS